MFTTTFYSYKGGVGRTSALMNVAHRLCRQGKTICVLDFDLEAPGLDSFESAQRSPSEPGLVEYVFQFIESQTLPQISKYLYEITPKGEYGHIFLMPAGRKDLDYQYALSQLNWKLLYSESNGYLVIEALRRSIEQEFKPDYLLIDSRTGLTDISGICTLQLPDLVVLLFNLNDQNINGTSQVYRSIVNNKLNRAIETLLVASPIPDLPDSFVKRSDRFANAQKVIGAEPAIVLPYDPFMSFQESIVDEKESRSLSERYDILTSSIVGKNDKDVTNLLIRARNSRDSGQIEQADIEYQEIVQNYPTSGNAWLDYGIHLRILRQTEKAVECFQKALSFPVTRETSLAELAITELQLRNQEAAESYLSQLFKSSENINLIRNTSELFSDAGLFEIATEGLKIAVEADPDDVNAATVLAQTLAGQGKYREALDYYSKLHQIYPTMLSFVFNAGAMSAFLGLQDANALLARAIELYESSRPKNSLRQTVNYVSAMAFAYEYLDRKQEAIRLLSQAITLADSLGKGDVYLFPQYRYVSKTVFIEEIRKRADRLLSEARI